MGNENSLSKGENKENKNLEKLGSFKIISTEIDSDYNGVKTCIDNMEVIVNNDNEEIKKSKVNLSTECSTGNLSDKEIKIPTKFEWKDGGNIVLLVGSFNNWSQRFIMNKISENIFELILVINFISFYFFKIKKINNLT